MRTDDKTNLGNVKYKYCQAQVLSPKDYHRLSKLPKLTPGS